MKNELVINQVLILFLMMAIGFFIRKKGFVTDEGRKTLNEILINVTSPFLVISSFNLTFSKEMVHDIFIVFIFSFISHIILIFIGKLIFFKQKGSNQGILRFVTMFSNCGFMGFPVLQALYGKTGVLYGSVFLIGFNVFIWTYGVMLLTGEKDAKALKKALLNPGVVSVFIGLALFLFSIKLPYPVSKTIDMVGAMTVPVSMFIIGSNMADMNLKDLFSRIEVYSVSVVRLVIVPIITLLILRVIGLYGTLLGTCVIIQAMPAASMVAVISEKYDANTKLASQCVFISTALSLITIPVIIFIMH